MLTTKLQKQSFIDFLQNRCLSKKFHTFYRKTLVLESLFNRAAGLKACNFVKKRLQRRWFLQNLQIYRNTFFAEHFRWLLLKSECKTFNVVNFTSLKERRIQMLAWCKNRTRTPGPGSRLKFKSGIPGPPSPSKFKSGTPEPPSKV